MATTAFTPRVSNDIKFEYGKPQEFALKFITPKSFDGSFGPRGMFTAADERKIWMDWEDASNLVIELRRLDVEPGDRIRVTKIKHPRGGGHGYHVARVDGAPVARVEHDHVPDWVTMPEAPTPVESQLEDSIALVRARGPQVFTERTAAPAPAPAVTAPTPAAEKLMGEMMAALDAARARGPQVFTERTAVPTPAAADCRLTAALKTAVDAALTVTAYAAAKGMPLAFTEESIRALAITTFIQGAR